MSRRLQFTAVLLVMAALAPPRTCEASPREEATVRQSMAVLQEVMATPGKGIPRQLLSNAQAVAIIPEVKSGAFVIGIRKGRGVLVAKDANGNWQLPQFVELAGGSVGWQAGIQSNDVILVFRSRESLANLMKGKLTIGADASVAAGPVGRQVAAATDVPLSSEIYSYSRGRGVFLGVSFDGSVVRPDPQADASFYQQATIPGQPVAPPAIAQQLVGLIMQYAGGPTMATAPPAAQPQSQPQPNPTTTLDAQMQESWRRLAILLTPEWQQYLALPSVFSSPSAPQYGQALTLTLQRYDMVAANPQFGELVVRPEFQTVYNLLRHAVQVQNEGPGGRLSLPPPPIQQQTSGVVPVGPSDRR